jgi:riboflavin kinase/FMN adenylyltransferase
MNKNFSGTIVPGSQRASTLGFPTANIVVNESVSGIFAGIVTVKGGKYPAAFFGDTTRGVLEAYILDFSDDIYGERALFTLYKKIREHASFESDEALKLQIADDVKNVREYFSSEKPSI